MHEIIEGDCLEVMKRFPDNHFSAIVTDPPYGLHFMGKDWDKFSQSKIPTEQNHKKLASGQFEFRDRYVPQIDTANAYAGSYDSKRDDEFQAFIREVAIEALRIVKPGGHLLMFGSPRRHHRQMAGLEDAGWEIRDCLMWIYGSGFPKSLDISKAIDKTKTTVQETLKVCQWIRNRCHELGINKNDLDKCAGTADMGSWWTSNLPQRCAIPTEQQWEKIVTILGECPIWMGELIQPANQWNKVAISRSAVADKNLPTWFKGKKLLGDPVLDEAKKFQGFGTALKPAYEPIILAMRPLDGTFAQNAAKWGQAGINIDGCRVGIEMIKTCAKAKGQSFTHLGDGQGFEGCPESIHKGRWPANVIFDEEAGRLLDEQSGHLLGAGNKIGCKRKARSFFVDPSSQLNFKYDNGGGASRFFYCPKTSSRERNEGLPDGHRSTHPTVKPLRLMEYLIRLVMPPKDGLLLDPFAGSGSTILAAKRLGFSAIGIEKSAEYCAIARARIASSGGLPGANKPQLEFNLDAANGP